MGYWSILLSALLVFANSNDSCSEATSIRSSDIAIVASFLNGTKKEGVPLILDAQRTAIVSLCRTSGHFAMTFDGGPSIYTGTVLDAFDKKGLKATFHPLVTYLQDVSIVANLQRAVMTGHLIGLSIEQDLDLARMDIEMILSVIHSRVDALHNIIGQKPMYLRIPNVGSLKAEQIQAITKAGFIITTYNLDSYDYAIQTTEDSVISSYKNILELLSNNTKGGFISVQRDTVAPSVRATSVIIDYIQSKGYKLVTLKDCVGARNSYLQGGNLQEGGDILNDNNVDLTIPADTDQDNEIPVPNIKRNANGVVSLTRSSAESLAATKSLSFLVSVYIMLLYL